MKAEVEYDLLVTSATKKCSNGIDVRYETLHRKPRCHPNNMLLGTVMHTLFDIPNLRLRNNLPAEVQRVITNAQPIKQLV